MWTFKRKTGKTKTPETTEKDLKAAKEILDKAKEIQNINADLMPAYTALLLIRYGRQTAFKNKLKGVDTK